ncbi:MAG TPA: hypothetical protein PK199_02935 [Bacteroidales bacterium]|nr:hypothetical protein [Bacteroidales bacterium]
MKLLYTAIICFFCNIVFLFGQSDSLPSKEIVKTNWNIGGIPVVAYNSDLGLQYGIIVNPFYYGDGSTYPNYLHKLYFEVSRYTKGSGIYRFYYNSKYIVPGVNTFFDFSYLTDEAYDFYGFNGGQSIYNETWIQRENNDYVGAYFYDTQRKMFRVKLDFQGKTSIPHLGWIAAAQYRNTRLNRPNFDLLNKGKSADELIPSDSTLYDKYVNWNLIPTSDATGGVITNVKCGLLYDSRDIEANPTKGIWTEAVVTVSPSFLSTHASYGICNITHWHYVSLIPQRLTFAYRAIFQSHLFGAVPWYVLPDIETSVLTAATNEGIGGAASMRGVLRNRIVGKQTLFGNLELRYKIVSFRVKKQNMYIATNGFYDIGTILQPLEFTTSLISEAERNLYFTDSYTGIHSSAGIGLKIAMNQNFIISVEYGKAMQKQNGNTGLYIRLNYLF